MDGAIIVGADKYPFDHLPAAPAYSAISRVMLIPGSGLGTVLNGLLPPGFWREVGR